MKTTWKRSEGSATHIIQITAEDIIIATEYPNPHAGGGGTSCIYEEFLAGMHHALITDLFSQEILQEVISSVKGAGKYDRFIEQRKETGVRKKFIQALLVDRSIEKLLKNPELINGFTFYGNAGGYNTEYRTGSLRFFKGEEESYIENAGTQKKYPFNIPGYCVSVVELEEKFFMVAGDNFWVINNRGTILYTTDSLRDSKNEQLFGAALRVRRTYRSGRVILVSVYWVGVPMPKSCLIFDPKSLSFTARYDLK